MGNKNAKQKKVEELMKKYETDFNGVRDKSDIDQMMKDMENVERTIRINTGDTERKIESEKKV